MKLLLLLLLISPAAHAQSVTPNFTTGTMTQTVTATQTVNETVVTERYGGDVYVWNGDNVEAVNAEGQSIDISSYHVYFQCAVEENFCLTNISHI